jgi:hypothetical protein
MLQLSTTNSIIIDGTCTGLKLVQKQSGTVIYTPEDFLKKQKYQEHKMPHERYSAAHDKPSSGVPGVTQLEKDVLNLLSTLD